MSADAEKRTEIKHILSSRLRGILGIEACLDAIEAAVTEFLRDGAWIDGWLAIRSAIRFDANRWNPEVKMRVLHLEERLRPSDPLNVARAYVWKAEDQASTWWTQKVRAKIIATT